MSNWIDFYIVRPSGQRPDYGKAEALAAASGDDEAEYYVSKMLEVLRDGVLDRDDMTEHFRVNGNDVYVFQDHNGIGDGGSTIIGDSHWMATDHPDIFKALAITVAWGKGTEVFFGHEKGRV